MHGCLTEFAGGVMQFPLKVLCGDWIFKINFKPGDGVTVVEEVASDSASVPKFNHCLSHLAHLFRFVLVACDSVHDLSTVYATMYLFTAGT
jgi:hypothetical protein